MWEVVPGKTALGGARREWGGKGATAGYVHNQAASGAGRGLSPTGASRMAQSSPPREVGSGAVSETAGVRRVAGGPDSVCCTGVLCPLPDLAQGSPLLEAFPTHTPPAAPRQPPSESFRASRCNSSRVWVGPRLVQVWVHRAWCVVLSTGATPGDNE